MKASTIVEKLQELIKKHGDLDVIYSTDDEGNAFYYVDNTPTACVFKSEDEVLFDCECKQNAICIN